MAIDLSNLNRNELMKLKADADQALVQREIEDRKAALAAAEKAAADYGYSLAELTGGTSGAAKKGRTPSIPKYQDPADPMKTWSGKGRQPDWFKAAIARGIAPGDMEI